jgi:predicted DCC family thiol-disulfide oxidoreductase YuxK
MKTLHNHVILYDADCPMCNLYTKAFVKTGMLDSHGRVPYSPNTLPPQVNAKRACNEIALVNCATQEVTYGIDSLFKILAIRFSFLNPLFKLSIFRAVVSQLYAFISYNRKVIAPAPQTENSCTPDFNLSYRVAYLIFAWIITSIILTSYAPHLPIPATSFGREFLICGGQLLFQGSIVWLINRNQAWNYLGNLMTVSLSGALILLPMLAIYSLSAIPAFGFIAWFAVVVTLMLFMHIHRVKLLGISAWLTLTWIGYRLFVLGLILN